VKACDKTVLGGVLEPVRHLGELSLQLWLGRHKLRGTASLFQPVCGGGWLLPATPVSDRPLPPYTNCREPDRQRRA